MTQEDLYDHILVRQDFFETERKPVESEWEAINQLILPRLEFMLKPESKGGRIGTKIYNGLPVSIARLAADGLFGYLVSPNLRWMKLCMANRKLEESPEVKTWLQECEEQLYYAFRSGFYPAIHEFFEIGVKLGTAIMYIDEDLKNQRVVFDTRELAEFYIAENKFGIVDTWHRKYKLAAREAVKVFDENKLPEEVKKDAKAKGNQDNMYEFLHAVYPNEDKIHGKLDSKNKDFYSGYLMLDSKKKIMLKESGYNKFPGPVWRWRKGNKGPWGCGPGHDSLVDIFGLNQIRKDAMKAVHLALDPALNVPDDMERVRVSPHGINRYSDPQRMIYPVHIPANFPATFELENKIEKAIEKHFMVEFFMLLSRQEVQKTATEIMELAGEKATLAVAVVGNIIDEGIEPSIDRTFTIEMDAGRMPEPPPEIYGEELEVEYLGQLAQAQKKWIESQGVQQGLALSIPFWEHFPEAKDIINSIETQRKILVGTGWPQEGIRSKEEVEEIQRVRAEEVQREKTMQGVERMADIAPKVSKKVEPGSIMEKMEKGAK